MSWRRIGADPFARQSQRGRKARLSRLRAALLGTVCLGALAPQAAQAVDATWTTPLGNDWQNGPSWSGGVVPDGTAIFTNNGANTGVGIFFGMATINTIRFDPGSPSYGISTASFSGSLDIIGAGIINNSSSAQNLSSFEGPINFRNSATAAMPLFSTRAPSISSTQARAATPLSPSTILSERSSSMTLAPPAALIL